MSYTATTGKKAPFENVNTKGERKASRSLDGKFYAGMRQEDGIPTNPFSTPAPNAVRIAGFTNQDYGNQEIVVRANSTAKVFGKGY